MLKAKDTKVDPALEALSTLSVVTESSADELNQINDEIAAMRQRRKGGWSWQRIVTAGGIVHPLSGVMRIVTNLSRASGEFRRELVRALNREGMGVGEIASLFEVSRQRVSALLKLNPRKDAPE